MHCIFYGIPSEQNVRRNIDKWLNTVFGEVEPKVDALESNKMSGGVTFVEKDENLKHFQYKLLGKYDVISLKDALNRYPDAEVYVTYRKAGNTAKYLLGFLPPEKIHFLEADLEYRKGCGYLGRFISYRKDSFSPCCVTGKCPVIKTQGTISERLAQWQTYTEKLVDDIRNERPNACQKCHLLKFGIWRKSVKLNEINLGSNQPGDICNFRCTYCFCENTFKRLKDATDGLTTYEVLQQLSKMPEYDNDEFIVQLANGEFCANKHCDEMLDILLKTNWKIELISNMSLYKEKLATLMSTGRVVLVLTSLDAGTRETFQKIKQNDRFDTVVANLKKYPVNKTKLLMKYIFLEGINDNAVDINGYYEVVKAVGGIISLSSNLSTPYTEKMKALTLSIIRKAKEDGVQVNTGSSYLAPQDAKFIREAYEAR